MGYLLSSGFRLFRIALFLLPFGKDIISNIEEKHKRKNRKNHLKNTI